MISFSSSRHYDNAVLIAPLCEEEYFAAYKETFPGEHFDVFSYEEICACFEYECDDRAEKLLKQWCAPEGVLPYLKRMKEEHYKDDRINILLPYVRWLKKEGVFQNKVDPATIFCGKTLIIRGYYSGTMIAEALQDLPNISLNWDVGRAPLNEEEHPVDFKGDFASAVKTVRTFLESLPSRDDIVLRYEGNALLPEELKELPLLHGPFVPTGKKVIYIEEQNEADVGEDILPSSCLAELRLPDQARRKARIMENQKCFLRHSALLLRVLV